MTVVVAGMVPGVMLTYYQGVVATTGDIDDAPPINS
jgi:hypothetical protein